MPWYNDVFLNDMSLFAENQHILENILSIKGNGTEEDGGGKVH